MWRWGTYLCSGLLIAVALVALPSAMIVESYVGGSAVDGYVADGRYFVNPGHSQPIVEVSESSWRAVYWLERLWPWSALIPCWIGMFLMASGMGPNWKPLPPPPKEMPPWVLRACAVGAGVTVAGAWLCWVVTRTPWVTEFVGCVLLYVNCGTVCWLYFRSVRQPPTAEPGATPEPGRDGASGSS
jgi:hypothetical protein